MPIKREAFEAPAPKSDQVDVKALVQSLMKGKSRDEQIALASAFLVREKVDDEKSPKLVHKKPETPDELWIYIRDHFGIELSRTAVCEGHSAPFEMIELAFFELIPNIFEIASRGGGKSFKAALLHELFSRFFPGCETVTFGAVEEQSRKVYDTFVERFLDKGLEDGETEVDGEAKITETKHKNGSKNTCFPATLAKVNGPHPPKVHSDEVEIMKPVAWRESQPLYTPVATPTGWTTIGALKLGDLVIGADGMPTKVTKIMDYGEADIYRVTLTDGRSTECCADHLWTVAGGSQRTRGVWKVMRTSDMIEAGLKTSSGYRFGIPHGKVVDYFQRELPMDPYVLGVMLGDGHVGTGTFVSSDPEIASKVESLLVDHRLNERPHEGSTRYQIALKTWRGAKTITSIMADLGLQGASSHTKFIPEIYKHGTRADRIELLRGLMDTDGCALEGMSASQYATVSVRLAHDLRELVFGLGGRAILRVKNFKSAWSSGVLYTLDISFGDGTIPFSLSRKVRRMTIRQRTLDPSIKSIEPAGRAQVRCIGVNNHDSTYRTTDFIVTHNSRNMASDKIINGIRIKAANIGTSTRKWKNGLVDKIYQHFLVTKAEVEEELGPEATKEEVRELVSMRTQFWVLVNCIFENAEQVPNCRTAPENADLPEHELCKCNQVHQGRWDNGDIRTLESVCRGRLYRSRGHRSYGEVVQLFIQNDRRTWEAQQECTEAESEGLYISAFSRSRHGLSNFPLDPANGPFYTGTDWGHDHAACTLWAQYLERPVTATRYDGSSIVIPAASRVIFSEIYEPGLIDADFGQKVQMREVSLARYTSFARLPIRKRWADVQGRGARATWSRMGLSTAEYSTRNVEEQISGVRGMYESDRVFVVVDQCPAYCDEIEGWRKLENGKESTPNDAMAAGRYLFLGMLDIYKDPGSIGMVEQLAAANASVPTAPAGRTHRSHAALEHESRPDETWHSGFRPSVPV